MAIHSPSIDHRLIALSCADLALDLLLALLLAGCLLPFFDAVAAGSQPSLPSCFLIMPAALLRYVLLVKGKRERVKNKDV